MADSVPECARHPRGSSIVFRSVVPAEFGGQPAHAGFTYAATVVEDSEKAIVTFQATGTPVMMRTGRRGPDGRNMLPGGWDGGYSHREWAGEPVVRVHERGRPWSVWRWLNDDGRWSSHFYVNLEEPWRRTRIGYDSHDWVLDLVVWREPMRIQFKDEDELQWCLNAGVIDASTEQRIRSAGEDAHRAASADAWPFRADWDRWLPDAAWPAPTLPEGWRNVNVSLETGAHASRD